ncbi:hypothetical protein HRR83_006367 [Exophiala dermatitidis]|uniref:Uncharacterized protein n=2 Tax=Exophiala dermatitidis TaxID=5970 RepID=H6CA41_EXODN|nr:uncharacterized protein HMPREF1120_07980 [Exophiala dermatitidis NIH/UT8656]KAJ4507380.1 hypothetical protein HRR75_006729 [Exophiala dermatitidis]EHY60005.1 hypothetical protein HMPREF1120_07980 [Exophiala dermatitidis NIH/UT8656]KAJ4509371.1 hypothetical protein HRR73_007225 [Exophiala dermatitidis]KAJ4509558.1 hypothetical protein HRR74_007339 [Exophiala dermatitidis]KAJ4530558.1 hypothetical protein HRR76_008266 [Exophiala dermatitidis]
MCHNTLFHFTCGCTQEVKRYVCGAQTEKCRKALLRPAVQNLDGPCPEHRATSASAYIHPAYRNGPAPVMPNVYNQDSAVRTRQPLAAPPVSFHEPTARKSSRSTGRSGNGSGSNSNSGAGAQYNTNSNLRDFSEIPHIPQPAPSTRRRKRSTASPSPLAANTIHDGGISKGYRRSSRSRMSPSPVSPLKQSDFGYGRRGSSRYRNSPVSPLEEEWNQQPTRRPSRAVAGAGAGAGAGAAVGGGRQAHPTQGTLETRKVLNLHRQLDVRRRREVYEDCEKLLTSRRYKTREELLRHPLFQELGERDREMLFAEYDARVRANRAAKGSTTRNQKRSSRCVVM